MKATEFLRHFTRVGADREILDAAEVRFTVAGIEVRLDMVRVDLGDPLTWTVQLTNDPTTPGHVLTAEEAEAAIRDRTFREV